MPTPYDRPDGSRELYQSFDCNERVVKTLITVAAFVALADGRLQTIERDEAVQYVSRHRLDSRITPQHIADLFEERARRLQDADFATLVLDAVRPVAGLSLTSDVTQIAERVAAADRYLHPSEVQVIRLIRLITGAFPESKIINSPRG